MSLFQNMNTQSGVAFIEGKPYGFVAKTTEYVVFGGELITKFSVKTENGLSWQGYSTQPEWAEMPEWVSNIFAGQLVW